MILRSKTPKLKYLIPLIALIALLALAACGGESAAPAVVELPPTWTPTPYVAPTAEPATPTPLPALPTDTPIPAVPPTDTPVPPPTEEPTPETPPTDTPVPVAKLVVTGSQANLRKGPGTAYDRVGVVRQGNEFVVLGKNAGGDWWQIQINGQPAWIYKDLSQVQNPEVVVVAENIPAPPVRATKPPPPPTNTPAPPAPHPCAGLSCKFHVVQGPVPADNAGNELKLQLFFIHSGVDGGQPQGSYFVAMFKDGIKLPIPDSVRSIAKSKSTGTLGEYNYEYVLNLNEIPGNTVAGNYTLHVIDGNGNRDSRDIQISLPANHGLVWIVFDQG